MLPEEMKPSSVTYLRPLSVAPPFEAPTPQSKRYPVSRMHFNVLGQP